MPPIDWNTAIIVGSNLVIFLTFMGIWIALYVQMRNDMKDFHEKWAAESKDFHGRMIKLEERYLSKIIKD